MAGFEDCARRITEGLELPEATKEGIRQEALAHLEDEAGRLVAQGKTREEAEALAIEAFGKGDAIAGLVDEALSGRQERYRRKKAIAAGAVVAGFGLLAVVLGTSLEFVRGTLLAGFGGAGFYYGTFSSILSAVVWRAAVIGAAALIAYKVSRAGRRDVAYAALGVFAVSTAVSAVSNLIVRYWWATYTRMLGWPLPELLGFFCLMLAFSWLTPIVIGTWGFSLRRGKGQVRLILVCLAVAAVNVAWAAAGLLIFRATGDTAGFMGWGNHLMPGLGLLTDVMLVWFLARAMSERRRAGEAGSEGRQAQLAS